MTVDNLVLFVRQPLPLAVFAAALAATLLWAPRLAARRRCPTPVAALFLAMTGAIVALTLTPNRAGAHAPHRSPAWWAALTIAPTDAEQVANIALYVPLGLLGALLWRSVRRGALFGLALTVAVESLQVLIAGRDGSLTDVRNNAAGALLGAAALAVARLRPRREPAG